MGCSIAPDFFHNNLRIYVTGFASQEFVEQMIGEPYSERTYDTAQLYLKLKLSRGGAILTNCIRMPVEALVIEVGNGHHHIWQLENAGNYGRDRTIPMVEFGLLPDDEEFSAEGFADIVRGFTNDPRLDKFLPGEGSQRVRLEAPRGT